MNDESPEAVNNVSDAVEVPATSSENVPRSTTPPVSRGMRLAKLMGAHSLVFLLALSLFAAADSWSTITGLGIATLLSVITGGLAGITIASLVHEWFHFAGTRYIGAAFDIPSNLGLFLYDWDFSSNSSRQFLFMSVAGSVGGFIAVILLWNAVPADSWGRAALRSGVIASVIFAALVEWPVIRRVREGGDPFSELAKVPQGLKRNFTIAGLVGILMTLVFVP